MKGAAVCNRRNPTPNRGKSIALDSLWCVIDGRPVDSPSITHPKPSMTHPIPSMTHRAPSITHRGHVLRY